LQDLINSHDKILMEGAIVEQLRHETSVVLHPTLIHAPLIYDRQGREELTALYRGYLEIALKANLPFLMCSPTWRTNFERVLNSGIATNINVDAVRFLQEIRNQYPHFRNMIKIGGMIGCKGDAYQPKEGLSCREAEAFHSWQISELVKAEPDFIIAETLPALEEARGIALAIEKTSIPGIISFVINREGCLLDHTPLADAISDIDGASRKKPLGYMVNCSWPAFLNTRNQDKSIFERLIGFLANASSLDHCVLDQSLILESDSITDWANTMLELNEKHHIKILGGCCGTSSEHLKSLVPKYQTLG
jgi:homocysteine S-methyltransferase